MRPVLTVFFITALSSQSAAQGVPHINVEPSCRAAAAGAAGLVQPLDSCRRSEQAARDTLVKQWGQFSAADRASCTTLATTGTPGTYTDLLTCLEMKRDARALHAKGADRTGTVGLGTRAPARARRH